MGEQEEDMDNIRVVLASASPRREELLRQIGIIPEVIPSEPECSGCFRETAITCIQE